MKTLPSHPTTDKDKVPHRERFSYASGLVAFTYGYSGLSNLAYPIFNMTLGVSPTLVGLVLALSRIWDAFTDPFMGSISDNSRLKRGRRIPFILIGSILCGITFPLIWFVPEWFSKGAAFWYFLVTTLLFFTAFTVFSVPYLSLFYELTPDANERTRVSAVNSLVAKIAGLSTAWVYPIAQASIFATTMIGMRWMAVLIGVVFIVFSLPVVFGCKERFRQTAEKQEKIGLIKGMKETLTNRAFLILVGVVVLMQASISAVGSLGIYINSYYLFDGDTKVGASFAAIGGIVYTSVSIASIPIATWLANRYGRRQVVIGCISFGIFAMMSKFFTFTPAAPYLQFVSVAMVAPVHTAFWVLLSPMKADTADYDEYRTGLRREGSYAAVSNWLEKAGLTVSLLVSGAVLDLIGFNVELSGAQSESTFFLMRSLYAFLPAILLTGALVLMVIYPLSEARMLAIRKEMETRRGTV